MEERLEEEREMCVEVLSGGGGGGELEKEVGKVLEEELVVGHVEGIAEKGTLTSSLPSFAVRER